MPRPVGVAVTTLAGHTSELWSVAFLPDGTRVAPASANRSVRLWDAATGVAVATLAGRTREVSRLDHKRRRAAMTMRSTDLVRTTVTCHPGAGRCRAAPT